MSKFKEPILGLLYQALHSEVGVEVQTNGDLEPVRQKLYAARREARDPDLDLISICQSPFDASKLWIVRCDAKKTEPSSSTPSTSI